MSESTSKKINAYQKQVTTNKTRPGKLFAQRLRIKSTRKVSARKFLEQLLATKKPRIFAEQQVIGGGRDWNNSELSILGDIGVAVPVTVFDNGIWDRTDPAFHVHQRPFAAELLYVSGPLFAKGPLFDGLTPDEREVIT